MTKRAQTFVDFVNKSPSPFHAVQETAAMLKQAGFQKLNETKPWSIQTGQKYFVTRNQSAIIAFAVGGKYKAEAGGFHIIGAHTDSPCLKVKPISNLSAQGYLQLGVECYGGGLFHTWFDRDLGLAGRVIVSNGSASSESKNVMINRPILRIPTLAIHLDRDVSKKGFQFNRETQLRPILATEVAAKLEAGQDKDHLEDDAHAKPSHHAVLMRLLAEELQVDVAQIQDFELCLFDTQGGNLGGALNEFIFAPRLDNLCCSWISTQALIESLDTLNHELNVRVVALFDNEEVGSSSLMGAASNFLEQTMARIAQDSLSFSQAMHKSFFVSADMAHAIHPNYADKHEVNHRPVMHKGPVIKYNANQRYATSCISSFLMKQVAKNHNIPLQEFVVRQDTGCGSTIGPILATKTGIRTIDVGVAQLSMHSIREMCGVDDVEHTIQWFRGFFSEFSKLDQSLNAA